MAPLRCDVRSDETMEPDSDDRQSAGQCAEKFLGTNPQRDPLTAPELLHVPRSSVAWRSPDLCDRRCLVGSCLKPRRRYRSPAYFNLFERFTSSHPRV
jgi:hypothetical protein